ncbi:MAG: Ig-like domain-containing protein [Clostridium sp.]|nr:Ig-like domain-containing protein [Clostridium sp.]
MRKGMILKNNLVMMVFIVMISVMLLSTEAQAAKLNKTSLTLVKGNTYTLKMSGTKKKVTWKTKNKKIAKLSNSKKSSVKIKAVKTGKTTVTAKVGKKTYKCRVTVIRKTRKKPSEATPGSTDVKTDTEQTPTTPNITPTVPDTTPVTPAEPDITPNTPVKPSTTKKKVWVITKSSNFVETPVYVNERTAIECTTCNYITDDFNQAVEHQDQHIHAGESNGYRTITIYDSIDYVLTECPEEGYWIEIDTNENLNGLKWRTDSRYPEGGYYYIEQSAN